MKKISPDIEKKEMISRALKNRRKGGGIKVYTIQFP